MTTQATPNHDSEQKRIKGSLAGTFIRTLLIITFIPLALMAGGSYFHARSLLQEQAVSQSQSLLATQLKVIDQKVTNKETQLAHLLESSDFTILLELALHANPKSKEFHEIRNNLIREFKNLNTQEIAPSFNQFLLLDPNGNIKIASNAKWEGQTLDSLVFEQKLKKHHSIALYGLSPIYEDEFILFTSQDYITKRGSLLGSIVGITEKKNLQELIQPLNGLSPLALTYFVLPDQRFVYNDPKTGQFVLVKSTSQNKINSIFSELIDQATPQPKTLNITLPDGEAALAQLQWFPSIQTGVVLAEKTGPIYSQMASLLPFTIILILGVLLATVLVIVIGINRVIKPLRSLSAVTNSFADGDWSRRAEVLTNDEVGMLASSFNQMADDLGNAHRSLEEKMNEGEGHIRTHPETAQNITSFSETIGVTETSKVYFEELAHLYRSSGLIVGANTEQEVLELYLASHTPK
jgi:HAMP domain-containing protein